MANRCISPINALPSKMRYGAVRARSIRYGGFAIETELPCINGLSAWFTIAHVDAIDDHELLMTEGAIGNSKDIAEAIVAALAKPASEPAGGDVREADAKIAEAQIADAIGDDDAAKAYRMACYDCADAIRALSSSAAPAVEASCDEMLAEAERLAAQIGYMVVPDPVHMDGEVHAPDLVLQMQPSLRALGFHAVPIYAHPAPATVEMPDDATPEMVAAALKVDWSNEDEEATVHNVWHAMCAALAPATEGRKS